MRRTLFLIPFFVVFLLSACGPGDQQGGFPPAAVDVATPLKRLVTDQKDFVGRFEAPVRVDLRARVTGYVTDIHFTDGQQVKKGDLLYTIDSRPFEFALSSATAEFTQAENEFKRGEKLRKTNAISQENFDRRAQDLAVAKAAMDEAALDLEFSKVVAPEDGKVSEAFVDQGNLVVADNTLLTRIVNINPIHFEFEIPQNDFLNYQRLMRSEDKPENFAIRVKLTDEVDYAHEGTLDFVDNVIDPGTGTIQARALVKNDDGLIVPGLFGRARLDVSGEYEALLLPEKAFNSDQDKKFVYVVNAENQAMRAYVQTGPVKADGMVVVRSGLSGDENVIISGVQFIRMPNQPVEPNEIDLANPEPVAQRPSPEQGAAP